MRALLSITLLKHFCANKTEKKSVNLRNLKKVIEWDQKLTIFD